MEGEVGHFLNVSQHEKYHLTNLFTTDVQEYVLSLVGADQTSAQEILWRQELNGCWNTPL